MHMQSALHIRLSQPQTKNHLKKSHTPHDIPPPPLSQLPKRKRRTTIYMALNCIGYDIIGRRFKAHGRGSGVALRLRESACAARTGPRSDPQQHTQNIQSTQEDVHRLCDTAILHKSLENMSFRNQVMTALHASNMQSTRIAASSTPPQTHRLPAIPAGGSRRAGWVPDLPGSPGSCAVKPAGQGGY